MNDSASKAAPAPDDASVPRHGRASLLRLARWFEAAEPETAHAIHTAAFATYRARHLSGQGAATVATTSWWNAPLADTAAAKLAVASPVAPVPDHTEQRARLRDAAESSAHWRRSAAREVRRLLTEPTRDDSRLHLTPAALGVLMDLLTAALGSGDAARGAVSAGDLELDIRLQVTRAPTASVVLSGAGGDLTIDGLRLQATSYVDGTAVPGDSDASHPRHNTGGRAGDPDASPDHPE
ncbi:DUF2397 family protein [Halostreptopolyspora alba]|uniref:DUF2397 family protein n=1 Tax=Halostreptopolyspora alba TaxID=2487137 RepID=UPI0026D1552E